MPRASALFAGVLVAALALGTEVATAYTEKPGDSYRTGGAGWAVPLRGPFESPFGYRWGRLHSGVDIAVLGDDRVHAASPGVVGAVGWLRNYSGYGLVVKIRHGDGVASMYAHLARASVRRGQYVQAGDLIGRAGCTGSCTGQHLHFEVHERGKPVDPLRYLDDSVRRRRR